MKQLPDEAIPLTDEQIERLTEVRNAVDVPSHHIRMMAKEIQKYRNIEKDTNRR